MKKILMVLGMTTAILADNAIAQSTTITTTTITNSATPPPAQAPQVQPATATSPVAADDNTDHSSKNSVPRFYIGVRALGTISTFKVNTLENDNVTVAKTTAVLGYGGGAYLGVNVCRNFAVQVEVLYSTLSQKYKDKGLDRRIDISYVNIPLMFVLNTDISKPVNFNITAGPQLGVNTGAKVSSVSQGNTEVVNSKFAVKATDFGFAYGAGLDFRLVPALSLGVGFRGVMGLVDISDKNSTATYSTTDNNGVTTTHIVAVMDKSKVRSYGGYVGLRFNF